MRVLISLIGSLAIVGCGQKLDHPAAAAGCDPATMRCSTGTPLQGGVSDGGDAGGASSDGDALIDIDGRVVGFVDDFFEQANGFTEEAKVSADGRNGSRVSTTYDKTSFELDDVLKTSVNWFLIEPAAGSGFLPTLMPLDTRSLKSDELLVAVARQTDVEDILQSLGTTPSTSRAQIVVRVVDSQNRAVQGVTAEVTAEVVAYRTSGAWLGGTMGTDDSGLLLIGNAQVGTALSRATVVLGGKTSSRVDVEVVAGATTVVTAVVTPK